jgi:hypothetical protein
VRALEHQRKQRNGEEQQYAAREPHQRSQDDLDYEIAVHPKVAFSVHPNRPAPGMLLGEIALDTTNMNTARVSSSSTVGPTM